MTNSNQQKLLYFAPKHFGIDEVILSNLKKYFNYDVFEINNSNYIYKNVGERIINLLSKAIYKTPIKKKWKAKEQLDEIKQYGPFEVCVIFRPDLLEPYILHYIKNEIPVRKVVYWDSFEKVPSLKPTTPYFNQYFSFEKTDCAKYGFNPIHNFYFKKYEPKTPEYDAFFFGSYDGRFQLINNILEKLNHNNIHAKAKFVGHHSLVSKHKNYEIVEHGIPFAEGYQFTLNTKAILEIKHPNQNGLSMRPFEALGLKRKIITNNPEIKNYDFYRENNIFIIEDATHFHIPNSFFETPFEELPQEIYDKYYIINWLKNILYHQ